MKQITLIALIALMLYSCSKNNTTPNNQNPTPNPNPNPTPTNVIDESKLKTRWEAISNYTVSYDSAWNEIDGNGVSQTYTKYGVQWFSHLETYITFSTGSYTHTNKDATAPGELFKPVFPETGSWSLKNGGKVITLPVKVGSRTADADFDVVEFKDNYLHFTYTDSGYLHIIHYELKK